MSDPLSARVGRDHRLTRLAMFPLLLAALYFGYRLAIEAWALNLIQQEAQRLDESGKSLNLAKLDESITKKMKREGASELQRLFRVLQGLSSNQRVSYWRQLDSNDKVENDEEEDDLEKLLVLSQPLIEAVRTAAKQPGPLHMKLDINTSYFTESCPLELAALLLCDASWQIRKENSEKVMADLQACVDLLHAYEIPGNYLVQTTMVEERFFGAVLMSMKHNIWNGTQLLELEKLQRDIEKLGDIRFADLSMRRSQDWSARYRGYGYGIVSLSFVRLAFDLPSDSAETLFVYKNMESIGSHCFSEGRSLKDLNLRIAGSDGYGIGKLSGFGTTRQTLDLLSDTWQTQRSFERKATEIAISLKRYQLNHGWFPQQLTYLRLDDSTFPLPIVIGYEVKNEKAYLWLKINSKPDRLPEDSSQEYKFSRVSEIK